MSQAPAIANLFDAVPAELPEELFTELLRAPGLRLERIVSRGHATPAGEWYDQGWDEWVLLIRGRAHLRIEGASQVHILNPGDYLMLPAGLRHRVEWTDPEVDTVWLAVHLAAAPS